MKVRIHKLFDYLLQTTEAEPEAVVAFSLSESPRLGEYLGELDPDLRSGTIYWSTLGDEADEG